MFKVVDTLSAGCFLLVQYAILLIASTITATYSLSIGKLIVLGRLSSPLTLLCPSLLDTGAESGASSYTMPLGRCILAL